MGWPGVTLHPQLANYEIAKDIWNYTHAKFTGEETWEWVRAGLTECAKYAADAGITLALQNHKPVVKDYPDVLRMIKEVGSPSLKASLDVPILDDKSLENINKRIEKAKNEIEFSDKFDKIINNRPEQTTEVGRL